MDTQRLILWLVFSFSGLMLWQAWQHDHGPQPLPSITSTQPAPSTATKAAPGASTPSAPAASTPAGAPPSAAAGPSGQTIEIRTDLYVADIDTVGGTITRVALEKHRAAEDTSKPYLVLLGVNVAAFAAGAYRLAFNANGEGPTIVMNMVWTVYNLALLGAAVSVASEAKQVRVTHRIAMRVPATLLLADGTTVACMTNDYSTGGLGLELPSDGIALDRGQSLQVTLSRGDRIFHFPARVTRLAGRHLGLQFESLTLDEERQFVQCTFGRADAWLSGDERPVEDMPLAGFKEVMLMGIEGYVRLAQGAMRSVRALLALDRARY